MAITHSEIALNRGSKKLVILNHKRLIQPKLDPQAIDIGLGTFLPQHVVDRIADKAEHRESNKSDHKQDEDRLRNAPDDVS